MPNYTTYNIKMVKGDTESFGFEIEGVENIDAAYFSCKRNSQGENYLFQSSLNSGITQRTANQYVVRIDPDDTALLNPGQYWYDLEISKNGDIFTIFRGVLELLPEITTPTGDININTSWGRITGNINNQTDLQAEFQTKADVSSLSTVATTGLYSDLTGTPNLATVATSGSYADLSNKPNLSTVAISGLYSDLSGTPNLAAVATSGSYTDLTNKPSIPTKTSDLTNDSNFVASTSLAAVATTGSYADLSNTPNFAAVATSGSYNDLTNKPTIPTLTSIVNLIYPVGSYYWNSNSTDPATLFGVGTWTQITNKFVYAAGGDYASGTTGGEETHTLTVTEMPRHRHELLPNESGSSNIIVTHKNGWEIDGGPAQGEGKSVELYLLYSAYSGSSGAHNNMPPYIVAYCWRRDA